MYCYKCGQQLADTAAFCSRCGAAMNQASPAPPNGPQPSGQWQAVPPQQPAAPTPWPGEPQSPPSPWPGFPPPAPSAQYAPPPPPVQPPAQWASAPPMPPIHVAPVPMPAQPVPVQPVPVQPVPVQPVPVQPVPVQPAPVQAAPSQPAAPPSAPYYPLPPQAEPMPAEYTPVAPSVEAPAAEPEHTEAASPLAPADSETAKPVSPPLEEPVAVATAAPEQPKPFVPMEVSSPLAAPEAFSPPTDTVDTEPAPLPFRPASIVPMEPPATPPAAVSMAPITEPIPAKPDSVTSADSPAIKIPDNLSVADISAQGAPPPRSKTSMDTICGVAFLLLGVTGVGLFGFYISSLLTNGGLERMFPLMVALDEINFLVSLISVGYTLGLAAGISITLGGVFSLTNGRGHRLASNAVILMAFVMAFDAIYLGLMGHWNYMPMSIGEAILGSFLLYGFEVLFIVGTLVLLYLKRQAKQRRTSTIIKSGDEMRKNNVPMAPSMPPISAPSPLAPLNTAQPPADKPASSAGMDVPLPTATPEDKTTLPPQPPSL